MNRDEIINTLILANDYKSYLEIGIDNGANHSRINCLNKTGVDPNASNYDFSSYKDDNIFFITSDEFFEKHCQQNFDIIFIDGLHLESQVDKDVENSLKFLSKNGTIVLHDCNPPTIHHARENQKDITPAKGKWNGTVWKSIVKLRTTRNDLDICVVDTDWGCGILKKSNIDKRFLNLKSEQCLEWDTFNSFRKEILNLIQPSEFMEFYGK